MNLVLSNGGDEVSSWVYSDWDALYENLNNRPVSTPAKILLSGSNYCGTDGPYDLSGVTFEGGGRNVGGVLILQDGTTWSAGPTAFKDMTLTIPTLAAAVLSTQVGTWRCTFEACKINVSGAGGTPAGFTVGGAGSRYLNFIDTEIDNSATYPLLSKSPNLNLSFRASAKC